MVMVDNIGSILFLWFYMILIWTFVVKSWINKVEKPTNQWKFLFLSFFLLAFGDVFHLIPRTYLWFVYTFQDSSIYESTLGISVYGIGLIITGITMIFFYLGFYYFWKETYIKSVDVPKLSPLRNKIKIFDWIAYLSVIFRIILILLPWNNWGSTPVYYFSVFSFRVITNLPLYVIGGEILYLFWISANAGKDSSLVSKDTTKAVKNSCYWIIVSFLTYTISLFGVPIEPLLGMMMIPKTIAYLVILYYMYRYIMANPVEKLEDLTL